LITRNQFSLRGASLSSATWYLTVALGWPLIAYGVWHTITAPGLTFAPAFLVVATMAVLLELLPLVQGRGHDPQGVVMSTSFSMAVLFIWGLFPAVVVIAVAALVADVRVGKQWWKTIFNPAQYALSIAAAYPVTTLDDRVSLAHALAGVELHDLAWMALAWCVYFAVNLGLVAGVLAWSAPFHEILRDDFWHYSAMSFAVFALSPLVAALVPDDGALIPLLLVPLLLIYYTAETSLQREHAAGHDALTGLPNRTTLRFEVDEALVGYHRAGVPFGLMLIDLDDFKTVNDTLGHQVGDALLSEISDRLASSLRPGDLVARLGGDEFAVLVHDADLTEVRQVAERLRDGVGATVALESMSLDVRMSIGIAGCPEDGTDGAVLLRHADVAMYRAKHERTGVEVYAAEHDDNSMARLALLSDLRRALAVDDQLELYYQPKVTPSGETLGVEALLRWQHPEHGLVLPDDFIPLAERSGVMPALTARVIALALRQVARWRGAGLDVQMAVNVAPTDFAGDDLPRVVARELAGACAGRPAPLRDHRAGHGQPHRALGPHPRPAAGDGGHDQPGRLRDRLLLPAAAQLDPRRRDQDRPRLRGPARRGTTGRRHRPHDDRPGARPRRARRGRGRRDRPAGPDAADDGVRRTAGLPHRAPATRRAGHGVAHRAGRGRLARRLTFGPSGRDEIPPGAPEPLHTV